jgi:cytochrome P450
VANHPDGRGELVSEVAAPLPLQVICDMMGIPAEDHDQIFRWTNTMLNADGSAGSGAYDRYRQAVTGFGEYGQALAEDRRRAPREDLTTSLVHAAVDGDTLTSAEIAAFFILLVFAGAETTRTAISHGLLALTSYPDQRQLWWDDFDALSRTAIEEIVRWSSPLIYMRRTLTRDYVLNGTAMAAGDKVTMWYASANRDERVFDDPWTFDVRRERNPHVGYGAGGVHFCLGANLARREIAAVFHELHRQIPDVAVSEEPERVLSPFVNSISALPVTWAPVGGRQG